MLSNNSSNLVLDGTGAAYYHGAPAPHYDGSIFQWSGNYQNTNGLTNYGSLTVRNGANLYLDWFKNYGGIDGRGNGTLTVGAGSYVEINSTGPTGVVGAPNIIPSGACTNCVPGWTVNQPAPYLDIIPSGDNSRERQYFINYGVLKGGNWALQGDLKYEMFPTLSSSDVGDQYTQVEIGAIAAGTSLTLNGGTVQQGFWDPSNSVSPFGGDTPLQATLSRNDGTLTLGGGYNFSRTDGDGTHGNFTNNGTIATLASGVANEFYQPFQNNGTLQVGAGSRLEIDQLNNLSGGVLTGGTYQTSGYLSYGASPVQWDGTGAIPITSVASGTTVALSGANAFFGNFNWAGFPSWVPGAIFGDSLATNAGVIQVLQGNVLNLSNASSFTNTGTLQVTGSGSTAVIGNWANVNSSGVLTGGTYDLENSGAIISSANITGLGTGTQLTLDSDYAIRSGWPLANSGLNNLKTIAAGASLTLMPGASITTDPGFNNAGTLTVDGAYLEVTGQDLNGVGFTNQNGAVVHIDQGGYLRAQGFYNDGTLTLHNNSTANFTGGAFTNNGAITVNGGSTLYYDGGPIPFSGDGEIVANADCDGPGQPACAQLGAVPTGGGFDVGTNMTVLGAATLLSGQFTIDSSGYLTLSGDSTFQVAGGDLVVDGILFAPVDLSDGMLEGIGTVGEVDQDGGVIKPGHSPGTLTIDGDYIQLADSVLEIDFALAGRGGGDGGWGPSYSGHAFGGLGGGGTLDTGALTPPSSGIDWGFLHVTGYATLGGSLELVFLDPDALTPGLYEIMDYAGLLSPGMTLIDPGQPGWSFRLVFNSNELDLDIESGEVPEPASWALLMGALALAGAAAVRRRA